MPSAQAIEDDERQYGHGPLSKEELDQKYPHRPHNHSGTPPFHTLFTQLFNPLNENKKKPTGPTAVSRAKRGPHHPSRQSPHEARRAIIARFVSRWRAAVGADFYPALRLVVPEKDRERALYGLREKAIARQLVKVLRIAPASDDARALLNWKLPGGGGGGGGGAAAGGGGGGRGGGAVMTAGDFAGRCYEVLSKRPMRSAPGDMSIAEVNQLLDRLAAAQGEAQVLAVWERFYAAMNAEELMWLVRIVLKQMKVGASEKTFLDIWHPDGEALFNVSSSLRRVCWELTDPEVRLAGDEASITVMQCFQPQLAQFQTHSFQRMVDNMAPTPDDPEFWIEEKLDGERMQLHMTRDAAVPGGRRFGFWSRRAKDYTYLYGRGLEAGDCGGDGDGDGGGGGGGAALTQHLAHAFDEGVDSVILDGEMITWDPEADAVVPFGTLKSAALAEQRNPHANTPRPLYRVFDILLLNGEPLTRYSLRDRRAALERCVRNVHRRLEKHEYHRATTAAAIEPLLRRVVAEASEGLVLKNPRSIYRLNSRNDDWMKVKPEYMTEFGESLDCTIIGGYYGSGHRGGRLSSFLCGLRVDKNQILKGANPMKHYSFCKVGGGFRAEDYATIRHATDGKWRDWDARTPPTEFVELGGGEKYQHERPDVWIRACDSVVISVKAASVVASDSFRMGLTLRFPRFRSLRADRAWDGALSVDEFLELKNRVEPERRRGTERGGGGGSAFEVDPRRRVSKRLKGDIVIAGNDDDDKKGGAAGKEAAALAQIGSRADARGSRLFAGLDFCVLSEALRPRKMSKVELEQLIAAHDGAIWQDPSAREGAIVVAEKRVVKVASLMKSGKRDVVRPAWLLDCLANSEAEAGKERFLLPMERGHVFHVAGAAADSDSDVAGRRKVTDVERATDRWGDSYARDVGTEELRLVLDGMPAGDVDERFEGAAFVDELVARRRWDTADVKGWLFRGLTVLVVGGGDEEEKDWAPQSLRLEMVATTLRFTGAKVVSKLGQNVTHVVADKSESSMKLRDVRREVAAWEVLRVPRVVDIAWVEDSMHEDTRLDEERYAIV